MKISRPGEDICVAIVSQEGWKSGPGEHVWVIVLSQEVIISGRGVDIRVAFFRAGAGWQF